MSRLRAAVIGVGYLGRFHAQKYKALESELDLELVGVCDLNPETSSKVASELGVAAFSRPEDLIGRVDAVTVATVTSSHYETAKRLLGAGVHCNVEKPMTVTVNEARELCELASSRGLKLCAGHSERFSPAFAASRGRVTNPVSIELLRHAPYRSRGADVGVIHDLMVHDLDLLLQLVPERPRLVDVRGGKTVSPSLDWAAARFEWAGGTALISVSRLAPAMTRTLRMTGPRESVLADFQTGEVQVATTASRESVEVETISAGRGDNLLAETRAFIGRIRGEKVEAVTGEDGLLALEWVDELMARLGER